MAMFWNIAGVVSDAQVIDADHARPINKLKRGHAVREQPEAAESKELRARLIVDGAAKRRVRERKSGA